VKFGIIFANTMRFAGRDGLVELAQGAEAAGFESLWTVEHVIYPDGYESEYPYDPSGKMAMAPEVDLPDPLVWLTWVAAVTERIHLGTGILILPQRNPVILAKELATIDHLSGGRMELGIGVGWLEEEFDALGVPFAGRGKRTDAYVTAMRALWTGEEVTLDDGYQRWDRVIGLPRPTNGTIPIVVGGHTEAAARRAGRLGDGFFPGKGSPDQLAHLFEVMAQAATDAGRDPATIELTAGARDVLGSDPLGAVEEMAAIGVDRVIIPPLAWDPDGAQEAYGQFGESVISKAS